jgi:metal-responsive CopG/Arc/MetJ family transcriptional regulator
MGRPKLNFDLMPGRFPEGTFARMDKVRREAETRTDFVREAVEREIKRREEGVSDDGGSYGQGLSRDL